VKPFNQEWKVYLKAQKNMDYDISRSAWQGDFPDAGTFLELFQSSSGNNNTGYKNTKYDELFDKANSTIDLKERDKVLAQVEEILLEDLPILPVYIWTNFGLLRPEVQGFAMNLVDRPYIRYFSKK
jgi:oligopeptide transport system substrate-binding protein